MKKLLSGLFLVLPTLVFACDCNWNGAFIEMANRAPIIQGEKEDVVIIGKVLEHFYDDSEKAQIREKRRKEVFKKVGQEYRRPFDKMVVEVVEVIKGKIDKELILVHGDNGYSCMPYLRKFPEGTTWAFVLFHLDTEFGISVCGEHWLEQKNGMLWGQIEGLEKSDQINSISLEKLKEQIHANKAVGVNFE